MTNQWDEWLQCARVHESGHAVAALAVGVSGRDITVEVRRTWSGREYGYGEVRPAGRWDDTKTVLVLAAGPEAEARWLQHTDGGSLDEWRRRVRGWQSGGGWSDMDRLRALLPRVGRSLADVEREAADLMDRRWRSVLAVARDLTGRPRLSWSLVRKAARS